MSAFKTPLEMANQGIKMFNTHRDIYPYCDPADHEVMKTLTLCDKSYRTL